MKNKITEIELVCRDLLAWIEKERSTLFRLNKLCTNDTDYSIEGDFDFIRLYLSNFIENNKLTLGLDLKPKGKTIIVLSYNEPFVTSIVPVLNALITGNNVYVRPSSKGRDFFKHVWEESGVVTKHNMKLNIIQEGGYELLENEMVDAQALYFFGGYKTAKLIASMCAKYFVQFYPEIEASDFKVFSMDTVSDSDLIADCHLTLADSFTHSGQSCQRIQGVYVDEKNYDKYVETLVSTFNDYCLKGDINKYVSPDFDFPASIVGSVENEIDEAKPSKVVRSGLASAYPALILNPSSSSTFVKSAYFLPLLWVIKYSTQDELFTLINDRTFHLGMNIKTDNEVLSQRLISETGYTRYTVNTDHSKVRDYEGWGGSWPTGYMGNKSWIELFTFPFQVIDK